MKLFSFPKSKRLVSNREFKAVLADNQRVSDGLLTLYIAENNRSYARLGVSIGKSSGPAVLRNRIKRLLREIFRQNPGKIVSGFDYLVLICPGSREKLRKLTFEQAQKSFIGLAEAAAKKCR